MDTHIKMKDFYCTNHPEETIQRVCQEKHCHNPLLCLECVLDSHDKTHSKSFTKCHDYLTSISNSLQSTRLAITTMGDIPKEHNELLEKKTVSIENFEAIVLQLKSRVNEQFDSVVDNLVSLCNKKRSEFLKVLDEQAMTLKSNFHLFEDKVHKFYGKSSTGSFTDIMNKINNLPTTEEFGLFLNRLNAEVEDSKFLSNRNESNDQKYSLYQEKLSEYARELTSQTKLDAKKLYDTSFDVVKKELEAQLNAVLEKHFTLTEELEKLSMEFDELGSKIITTSEDRELLKKWLGNKKDMKFKLLYRSSGTNYTNANFHSKCDNIPHTITLMKSNTGRILGGYADQTWNSFNQYKNSSKLFIFDLKEKKQYLPTNPQASTMFCGMNSGPAFGSNSDFTIGSYPVVSPFLGQSPTYTSEKTPYRFIPVSFFENGQAQCGFNFQQQLQQQQKPGNVDCIEVFQLEYPGIENAKPDVLIQFSTFSLAPGKNAGGLFPSAFNFGVQPSLSLSQPSAKDPAGYHSKD